MASIETASGISLPLKDSESNYHISPERKRIPIRRVIFDGDGTLVDVIPEHRKAFVDTVNEMLGIHKGEAWLYYEGNGGKRTPYQVLGLMDKLNMDAEPELIDEVIESIYNQRSRAWGMAFDEVPGNLERLRRDGISMAVSTFAREQDAIEKFRYAKILDFFKLPPREDGAPRSDGREYAIVGRDSVGLTSNRGKGEPHYRLLAEIFGVKYSDLVRESAYIADTVDDLLEAGSTGIRLIGIADIISKRDQLIAANARAVVDVREFGKIPSLIKFL